jgi:hypothetical protein
VVDSLPRGDLFDFFFFSFSLRERAERSICETVEIEMAGDMRLCLTPPALHKTRMTSIEH